MATVNAGKWGYVGFEGSTSFSNSRGQSTGDELSNNYTGSNRVHVSFFYDSGKGGTWAFRRGFYAFNVSSYASGYTISNLKFYYKPTASGQGTCLIAAVKSTAQGNADTDLALADYDSYDQSVNYAANDGSIGWFDGTALSYFDLNSTAISAFTSSYLKICILEYTHDYSNSSPFANTNISGFLNGTTTPYLSFTATPTGWSYGDINGVTSPQEELNAVSYTNMDLVNGVPFTP